MKVVVDLTHYINYTGRIDGLQRYLAGLLPRLRRAPELELSFVVSYHQWREMKFPSELKDQGCKVAVLSYPRQVLLNRLRGRLDACVEGDLIFAPVSYARPSCRIPVVCTVHDVLPYAQPEYARYGMLPARHHAKLIRSCRRIIAVSRFTASQVIEHLGASPERVTVIHNGLTRPAADEPSARPATLPEDARFFLALGGARPWKNSAVLFRAFQIYQDRGGSASLVLLGESYEDRSLEETLGRAPQGLVSIPYASEAELSWLYRNARAFLFPSKYEGFGLAPLEAMARGCPTVAADAASLPEVLGDGALLLDPDDHAAWADAMRRCELDRDWRSELSRRGADQAAIYSWDRTAELYLEVFRQVTGRAGP